MAETSKCMGCGQAPDAHAKHQIINVAPDGTHFSTFWHHDCHTMVSPPCEICQQVLAQYPNLHGDELRDAKIADQLTAAQVHAAQISTGDADPTSDLHDPAVSKSIPEATLAALTGSPVAGTSAATVVPGEVS